MQIIRGSVISRRSRSVRHTRDILREPRPIPVTIILPILYPILHRPARLLRFRQPIKRIITITLHKARPRCGQRLPRDISSWILRHAVDCECVGIHQLNRYLLISLSVVTITGREEVGILFPAVCLKPFRIGLHHIVERDRF